MMGNDATVPSSEIDHIPHAPSRSVGSPWGRVTIIGVNVKVERSPLMKGIRRGMIKVTPEPSVRKEWENE